MTKQLLSHIKRGTYHIKQSPDVKEKRSLQSIVNINTLDSDININIPPANKFKSGMPKPISSSLCISHYMIGHGDAELSFELGNKESTFNTAYRLHSSWHGGEREKRRRAEKDTKHGVSRLVSRIPDCDSDKAKLRTRNELWIIAYFHKGVLQPFLT